MRLCCAVDALTGFLSPPMRPSCRGVRRSAAFAVRDEAYLPNYEEFVRAQGEMGGDGFLVTDIGYPPLQYIMDVLMGLNTFAEEWTERRDEVLRLYDALVENRRKVYEVVAESPALAANYEGNVSAEVVGVKRFEQYYMPHYDEFAEVMHAQDKLVGVHFDANTWLLSEVIGRSGSVPRGVGMRWASGGRRMRG